MEAHEFGRGNDHKIVLIPGNMMCWKQFEDVIPLLAEDHHVVAVSTDGYDGGGTTFTTAQASAEKLEAYEKIDSFAPDANARVAVWRGAKEPNMKTALQKLRRAYPSLEDHPFPGFGHGEIIAHPELMAEEIRRFLAEKPI